MSNCLQHLLFCSYLLFFFINTGIFIVVLKLKRNGGVILDNIKYRKISLLISFRETKMAEVTRKMSYLD